MGSLIGKKSRPPFVPLYVTNYNKGFVNEVGWKRMDSKVQRM